jgi:type II secretory pathway pseudopilin PulG
MTERMDEMREKRRLVRRKTLGFTLVETMFSMILVFTATIGTISAITLARETAEYDKQRLSAISVARHYLELVRHDFQPERQSVENIVIDDFNTPDDQSDDLLAVLDLNLYEVNADGTRGDEVDDDSDLTSVIEVEAVITWNRTGRRSSKRVSETLITYVSPDL